MLWGAVTTFESPIARTWKQKFYLKNIWSLKGLDLPEINESTIIFLLPNKTGLCYSALVKIEI